MDQLHGQASGPHDGRAAGNYGLLTAKRRRLECGDLRCGVAPIAVVSRSLAFSGALCNMILKTGLNRVF